MFILLVALSFYQNVIADHEEHYLDLAPLLASLKAAERAADEVAGQIESKSLQKPVLQKDLNLNEDVIKEAKLRKILELIKENNRAISQDINESRGPRVFMIKKDISDIYEKVPKDVAANTKVTGRPRIAFYGNGRRSIDLEISGLNKEKQSDVTHLYQKRKPIRGKARSYLSDDDEDYTTRRSYQSAVDISREHAPGPLLQFPKYTDGIFNNENDPGKRNTPRGHLDKPRGIPFHRSKEERWDAKIDNIERSNKRKKLLRDDDSLDRSSEPQSHRGRGYRGKNQLFGRTPIPYGKRYVYED